MPKLVKKLKDCSMTFFFVLSIIISLAIVTFVLIDSNNINYNTRIISSVTRDENLVKTVIKDSTTPLNEKKIFERKVNYNDAGNELCFYMVHDYARVYVGNELVYRFEPGGDKLGKTLGCTWAFIPIEYNDIGKTLRIEITPVYQVSSANDPVFLIGDSFMVFISVLYDNLPMLILCILILLMGLILIVTGVTHTISLRLVDRESIYIGIFSISLVLWKFMDSEVAPLLIYNKAKFIFYSGYVISLLTGPCLTLYFRALFSEYKRLDLISKIISSFAIFVNLFILVMQIFNIFDVRELLILILASLLIILFGLSYMVYKAYKISGKLNKDAMLFMLSMGIGSIIDLIIYIINRVSTYCIFSFVAFFIYLVFMGIKSISTNSAKTYIDQATGLFNKSYSIKMMNEMKVKIAKSAIVMMDLNDLKKVNDDYGHEEGDLYIKDFSELLKKYNHKDSFSCRIGGDEFIILMLDTSNKEIEEIKEDLALRVKLINDYREIPLSYAIGSEICKEYNTNFYELLKIADMKMYQNKIMIKKQKMN